MTLLKTLGLCATILCAQGCSGSDETLPPGVISSLGTMRLERIEYGRLVEVYGYVRLLSGETVIRAYRRDVVIDPTIADQRSSADRDLASPVLYDFLASDPDRGEARLLIAREIDSEEFREAYQRATSRLRPVSIARQGAGGPRTMVPRDAALKLSFDAPLNVNRDFFERRDAQGVVTSLKNSDAIRVGVMDGDPDAGGRTHYLPVRYIIHAQSVVLDPVLTGREGAQYQVPNRSSGLPASPNQLQPNMRLALALGGPLAMVGFVEDDPQRRGDNGAGQQAMVCDFRVGNAADQSSITGRGYLREPRELTLMGQVRLGLSSIEALGSGHLRIEVDKLGVVHEIDRGDRLRVYDVSGQRLHDLLVVAEPQQDEAAAAVQRVTLLVSPSEPESTDLQMLVGRTDLSAYLDFEFTATRSDGTSPDDPRYCLSYGDRHPLASGEPLPAGEYVSPFESIGLRFNRPVDRASVDGLESFFIATRDILDRERIEDDFLKPRDIDPAAVSDAKFRTPHMVASRVVDDGGDGTQFRLTPVLGLYLDDRMRTDEGLPFESKRFRYYAHLRAGLDGIHDRSGQPLDFGSPYVAGGPIGLEHIVVPFSLDTRTAQSGQPVYANNRVVYLVRRFADEDEDERPSIYLRHEMPTIGQQNETVASLPSRDLFGAVTVLRDGSLLGRPTSRIRKGIDGLIGQRMGACPKTINNDRQVWSQRAPFPVPLGTPLNHYGSRMQTVYREIDLGLSFWDPHDFDLDVEALYWAPLTGSIVAGEEFERTSLYLGHSEARPEPCIGSFSGLLFMPHSGIGSLFEANYAANLDYPSLTVADRASPHVGYEESRWRVDPQQAIADPSGTSQVYLPFPKLQRPYFVWRDQKSVVQGGNSQKGSDVANANQVFYDPYLPSPFAGGQGRVHQEGVGGVTRRDAFWENSQQYGLGARTRRDIFSGGGLASLGLPLMLDLWTYPDSGLSASAGTGGVDMGGQYRGPGDLSLGMGWQVSIFTTQPTPIFRTFSAGIAAVGGKPPVVVDPSVGGRAAGGYNPRTGQRAGLNGDNANYWLVADFLKRQTVATAGFVDLSNPHRVPRGKLEDPRLGPFAKPVAAGSVVYGFDPLVEQQLPGTQVRVEFRAAGPVDSSPWRAHERSLPMDLTPDADNFPLDPLKAGDAQLRKFDDRPLPGGQPRNYWTQFYNRNITRYTSEPNQLFEDQYLAGFRGEHDQFGPDDVSYLNWRFTFINDTEAQPPKTPSLRAFWVAYRLRN